jgi:DNA-binding NtrC family response regulator
MTYKKQDTSVIFDVVDEKIFGIAVNRGMKETVRLVEAAFIAKALDEGMGNLCEAARILKIPSTTLTSRRNILLPLVKKMEKKL